MAKISNFFEDLNNRLFKSKAQAKNILIESHFGGSNA